MNRLGFRLRQPAAHAAGAARERRTSSSTPSTRTSPPPTIPESPLFDEQRVRFERALADVEALGGRPRYRHACNSAALLRDSRVWFDRVRPGLLLYGIVPPPLASTMPLDAGDDAASRVVAVKGLRPGEIVGYGARFTAERPTTIAIVPGRLRRRPRSAARRPRLGADSRPPRADRRLGLHGHADGRRHRAWTCRRATRS